jgi:hypothetical protein
MQTFVGDESVAQSIEETRTRIRDGTYSPKGIGRIEGGVAKGEAVFVSWVDELVWHSSPYPGPREGSPRLAIYRNPAKYVHGEGMSGQDSVDFWLIMRALRSLRRIQGTAIYDFPRTGGGWVDQIYAYVQTIVDDTGAPTAGWARHLGDIDRHISIISLGHGEEQASDPSNENETITRRTKIGQLRRRNSLPEKLDSLRQVSRTTEPRSFIRTWVQIHRA